MAAFFPNKDSEKQASSENGVLENVRFWPLRIRTFLLQEDFVFSARQHPEIFIVSSGGGIHESGWGKIPLHSGSVIVANPGSEHKVLKCEDLHLERMRYLPEWLAGDFGIILSEASLFELFFASDWFNLPLENATRIFHLSENALADVLYDLKFLRKLAAEKHGYEPLFRVSFLKLLFLLAAEYLEYQREKPNFVLRDDLAKMARMIEIMINRGKPLRLKTIEDDMGVSIDHLGRIFKRNAGVTLVDYAQKRRVSHTALRLLISEKSLTQIAKELGFSDQAHLTRSFKRYFDMSPHVYRDTFGLKQKT